MPVTAIVGTQWGDEGKGRIVDLLAQESDMVIRFQGGTNAGHTVVNDLGKFALHLVPSGIFNPACTNVIGAGVVVNPGALLEEMEGLAEAGVTADNLIISDRAHVVMPYHISFDRAEEARLGAKKLGTTLRGIGPVYSDKALKVGVRMGDLLDGEYLDKRIPELVTRKNETLQKLYDAEPLDAGEVLDQMYTYGKRLGSHIEDILPTVHRALDQDAGILLEGQLGAMRDLDWGIYPFTTASSPLAGFGSVGAGIPPYRITRIVGVVKAYSTCVGSGPLPTELKDEVGDRIREIGKEYGASTGRPRRIGWFDAVAAGYGVRVTGATEISITLLDVLSFLPRIRICIGYRMDGQLLDSVPSTRALEQVEPVYEEVAGWEIDISDARRFEDLPENAQRYVKRIEELLGVPARFVSIGPERNQMVRK